MAAAADLAGVARTLKQQAGVRSLVPLEDAHCGGTPGVAAAALGLHHNATTGTFYFPSIAVIL